MSEIRKCKNCKRAIYRVINGVGGEWHHFSYFATCSDPVSESDTTEKEVPEPDHVDSRSWQ